MATPKTITDGSTPLDEDNLNKFVSGDGTKVQIKTLYASIVYDSGNIVVDSGADSCGIVTGDLFYNTGTDILEITIAGFTNPPVAVVSPLMSDTSFGVKATAISNTEINVAFYDVTTGANASTGAIDPDMNFNLIVIGF